MGKILMAIFFINAVIYASNAIASDNEQEQLASDFMFLMYACFALYMMKCEYL